MVVGGDILIIQSVYEIGTSVEVQWNKKRVNNKDNLLNRLTVRFLR